MVAASVVVCKFVNLTLSGFGCRVQGAEFWVQGAGCRVLGAGCRVQSFGAGCRVQSFGLRVFECRVIGSQYGVQGLGFRGQGSGVRGHIWRGCSCVLQHDQESVEPEQRKCTHQPEQHADLKDGRCWVASGEWRVAGGKCKVTV
jgi:hypothetical protein